MTDDLATSRRGTVALVAHAEDCDECRAAPLPIDQLASALRADEVSTDAAALSQRTLMRLRPDLVRLADAASRRRLGLGLVLSLLPLPAVIVYDAFILRLIYSVVSLLLPAGMAAYLVGAYAASVVLLFGLTYAAIPLLVAQGTGRPLTASGRSA